MNDVAEINLAEADDAVDWRDDGRVVELGLRRFDSALVGIERCLELVDLGLLQVDVLLCLEILF